MQLTVCAETLFADRPMPERFAAIQAQGIAGIELWGLDPHSINELEKGLRSAGCRLELFCGNRDHSLIDPGDRDGFFSELRENMSHARRLGCRRLTILSDRVDRRGIPIPPSRPLTDQQKWSSILAGLKQ